MRIGQSLMFFRVSVGALGGLLEGSWQVKAAFGARDRGCARASLLLGSAFGGIPEGYFSRLRPRRVDLCSLRVETVR